MDRVDGPVSIVMALGQRMISETEPESDSIYDDPEARPDGLLTF